MYRGIIDTPKSAKSVTQSRFFRGSSQRPCGWDEANRGHRTGILAFPSENLNKPLSRDKVWRRHIRPKLKSVGLDWVNFLVLRRTHSTLMRGLSVDPKLVADQQGHAVDVNLNVYTEIPVELK